MIFGYRRKEDNDWRKFRKVAFYSAVGSHLDHKKLPKNEIKFFPIGDELEINPVTDEHKQKYISAMKLYYEKINKNKTPS